LAFLFDRFYRVERSRQRQTGGAGLGLTICQNIVKAHNGDIKAALSSLDGLEISITLPILNP
jgi:two-component system sensor histidine kinase BaeS